MLQNAAAENGGCCHGAGAAAGTGPAWPSAGLSRPSASVSPSPARPAAPATRRVRRAKALICFVPIMGRS
ncbi:hypothetical protein D0T23_11370 [Duganella sp. BJB475]|nr:hypothetical protein D0T23_11370 [Duganella sp. BJB475]RFP30949.1 hypothetical protein D0T21_13750 [Duganella sp. BJB476]